MKDSKLKRHLFNLVTGRLEKYEPIFIALILMVLGLNTIDQAFVEPISIIIFSTIGIVFVMSAYRDPKDKGMDKIDLFFNKIGGFGSTVALMGILFSLVEFPGSKNMLVLGALACVGSTLYFLIKQRLTIIGKWTVLRLAVIGTIAIAIFAEKMM